VLSLEGISCIANGYCYLVMRGKCSNVLEPFAFILKVCVSSYKWGVSCSDMPLPRYYCHLHQFLSNAVILNGGSKSFDNWSKSSCEELEKRKVMKEAALPMVDQKIAFFGQLPEAINTILEKE
jgi:hypothetical protein